MRGGNIVFIAAGLLLLAACTRTIIVTPAPAPDRGQRGSRPPPRTAPEPEPPDEPVPPRSTAATLGIPPGHLPQIGECRVWIPGTPPGRQPRPRSRSCAGIAAVAPAGSWIVYRPTRDRKLVHVRVVDERRPGVVIRIQVFDIDSRELVREEEPDDERGQNERPRQERPRDERPRDERPPENRPPEQRPPLPPPQIMPPIQLPAEQRPPENKPPTPPPVNAPTLRVPPGHWPDVGECRVWIPLLPPGLQPKPKSRSCDGIASIAPAGSWIVYRPSQDRKVVHLRLVDERRAGVVIRIQVFDIESLRLLREENP